MEKTVQKPKYHNLHIREIEPQGWLRRQLEIQAKGLCGNLDLFWEDIKDSKWIGGTSEGWERVPYWLDGFIPLAFLLHDEDMIKRANYYIEAILNMQQEDGWICPCSLEKRGNYDIWSLFLILKVLMLYQDVSEDERVEDAIYRALKNLERHIDMYTLSGWAQMRWYECLQVIYSMYEKRSEEWLLNLAVKLKSQGFDYQNLFDNFPYRQPVSKDSWSLMSHGVNMAMAIRSKALEYLFSQEEKTLEYADFMLGMLEKYHGMITGVFSCDECLSGKSPVQGTELCAVTELMYSLETLSLISGKPEYAEHLERIAFNALPAALSPDMWSHQYDQQVNQINCIETEKPIFNTNCGEANIYGLEPHFGCCTVNFGQGWPKFAMSTILKAQNGFYIASYAPNKVISEVYGIPVSVEVKGAYPFEDDVSIVIEAKQEVEFALYLRIPQYAHNTIVTLEESYIANAGEIFTIKKKWKQKSKIDIHFSVPTILERRPENLVALKRGALVFSLKLEEEWLQIHKNEPGKEAPHCDYEVHAKSEWRYGIADTNTTLHRHPIGEFPFSPEGAPLELMVSCVPVNWKEENTYAARVPVTRKPLGKARYMSFIPYGCTNIRMTELPYIGEVIEE